TKLTTPRLLVAGFLGLALLVGCRKPAAAPPPAPVPAPPVLATGGPSAAPAGGTGPFAAARATFDATRAKSHPTGDGGGATAGGRGPGGGGPGPGGGRKRGPDLARVGADPKHTRQWFIDYIRDPKTQKPDSRMPPFGNQLSDNDLGSLADYLSSLKGA